MLDRRVAIFNTHSLSFLTLRSFSHLLLNNGLYNIFISRRSVIHYSDFVWIYYLLDCWLVLLLNEVLLALLAVYLSSDSFVALRAAKKAETDRAE